MKTIFRNVSVRIKFFILAGMILVTSLFSMFGLVQFRLISHFQNLERDHIILVTGLQTNLERYLRFLEDGSEEAVLNAKDVLQRRPDTPQNVLEKGILQIFEEMQVIENRVFEDTTAFDRKLFDAFGFGGIFELTKEGIRNVEEFHTYMATADPYMLNIQEFRQNITVYLAHIYQTTDTFVSVLTAARALVPRLIITITAALFLCVIVLLLIILVPLTSSLRYFATIARIIAEGQLETSIQLDQKDEIGMLAQAFRIMQQQISAVSREITNLTDGIRDGHLEKRGDAKTFTGDWEKLINHINDLIEAFVVPITFTTEVVANVARGDIPKKITEAFRGDFDLLAQHVNALIEATENITHLSQSMAEGNLSVNIQERSKQDTLMRSLNVMCQRLEEIAFHIKVATDNVTSGSQSISSVAAELSRGTTTQAASVEEISASMEQMAANIRQNADNASRTEKIAQQAAEYARKSGEAVNETVHAMQKIVQEIAVVEEIALQTHMLSLNATIEAAKAEQYGKGFAVVASEVRSLAEHSKKAAQRINELAHANVTVAENAGEMLGKLIPDIGETAELIQQISLASHEQKLGTEQINHAIQNLDMIIQQNAAMSEQLASKAKELATQAEHSQNILAFFHLQKKE